MGRPSHFFEQRVEKLGEHFKLLHKHCSNYSLSCLRRHSAEAPPHYSALPQYEFPRPLWESARSFLTGETSVSISEPC